MLPKPTPTSSNLQYPNGVVKQTWAFGHARSSTDIKIEEMMFNSKLAPVRADVTVTLDVIEDDGNAFYQVDKQRRNVLAALGLQNIKVF